MADRQTSWTRSTGLTGDWVLKKTTCDSQFDALAEAEASRHTARYFQSYSRKQAVLWPGLETMDLALNLRLNVVATIVLILCIGLARMVHLLTIQVLRNLNMYRNTLV